MKSLLTFILVLVPLMLCGQDYVMYETNYLSVHPEKSAEFGAAMKAHNDQFHAEGPFRAVVHYVVNGPRTGQFSWIMGPTTFSHLDDRPNDDAHNNDWFGNVMSLTDGSSYTEYWRLDPDRSYTPDTLSHPILRIRFIDVKRGASDRFDQLMAKVNTVRMEKNYSRRTSLFKNRLWHDDGHDVAIVTNFDSWSDLDEENTFAPDYEDVFGAGSWHVFLNEWNDVVESAREEFRSLVPSMSGGDSE